MTGSSGEDNLVGTASCGVEDLTNTATSVLGQGDLAGALAQPVVDALHNVWEGYFGSPVPPGDTNWDAYTHQQLYQMLWDNADVGDVSSVAAEWGRHSTELTDHSHALQAQRGALQSNWSGAAAGLATDRLGELADSTAGIGTRAGTVQLATQNAGDALAVARNTMPQPSVDPIAAGVSGAVAGGALGAVAGGVIGAGAGGVGAGPGAVMGAAIGAVAVGGGSMFLASAAAAEKKAEAVHVMQRYESSLRDSGHAVTSTSPGAAGSATPRTGMDGQTSAAGYLGAGSIGEGSVGTGSIGRGVPWGQLIGTDPLQQGAATGVRGNGPAGALTGQTGAMSELAHATNTGGGMPGGGARGRREQDREHPNRLPTVDQRLFAVDERVASTPVIGL